MLADKLTVDQAVQIAILNNQHLQATLEDLGIAQADLVQAGLLKNPVFDLGVRIPTGPPSKTYVDINVAEDFIGVFFIPARQRIAEAEFARVKSQVVGQVLDLAADTKAACYRYQAALQIVELRKSIAQATGASAMAAKRLHDAGNNTDLDYDNALARDVQAEVELDEAESDSAEARETLNDLMGLDSSDVPWRCGDRLRELPETDGPLNDLEQLALRQRADLAAARQDVDARAKALGFTRDTRLFSGASVGAEGERETDGQWRVGPSVSVPLPIFDQGQAAIPRASHPEAKRGPLSGHDRRRAIGGANGANQASALPGEGAGVSRPASPLAKPGRRADATSIQRHARRRLPAAGGPARPDRRRPRLHRGASGILDRPRGFREGGGRKPADGRHDATSDQ
jgi:cobalt-zinc-cadmium efflux system outer membrane protein